MAILLTVQHTGTWFFIEFFKKFNIEFDYHNSDYKHIHMPQSNAETKKKFLHRLESDGTVGKMDGIPTYAPLRDPVLSLISRHKRHPKLNHNYLIYGFEWLAQSDQPHIMIAPGVDLPLSQFVRKLDMRIDLLDKVSAHLGIKTDPTIVKEYAKQWKPVNVKKEYLAYKHIDKDNLHSQYYESFDNIRKIMPEECELLLNTPVIQKMLVKYNYDLPWFV